MRYSMFILLTVLLAACASQPPDAGVPANAESNQPAPAPLPRQSRGSWDTELDFSSVADPQERLCLDLIDECPRPGHGGNPIDTVRAINALIPLGNDGALSVLREYTRHAASRDIGNDDYPSRVFTVAQLAFVSKQDGQPMRCGGLGGHGTVVVEDSRHWNAYPYVLVDDLPLTVSMGLTLFGQPEPPSAYLDYIERVGELRTHPLHPADNPLEAADRLIASAAWTDIRFEGEAQDRTWRMSEAWLEVRVRQQALNAVSNLCTPEESVLKLQSHTGSYPWNETLEAVRAIRPQWSAAEQRYVALSAESD